MQRTFLLGFINFGKVFKEEMFFSRNCWQTDKMEGRIHIRWSEKPINHEHYVFRSTKKRLLPTFKFSWKGDNDCIFFSQVLIQFHFLRVLNISMINGWCIIWCLRNFINFIFFSRILSHIWRKSVTVSGFKSHLYVYNCKLLKNLISLMNLWGEKQHHVE